MKKNLTSYLVPISIIISGIFISLAIYFVYSLDVLQKLFSILGSLSLVIAVATYFYKKRQDVTLVTTEQITFFREKVIPLWQQVRRSIKETDATYWFSKIEFKPGKYALEDIKEDRSDNFKNQLALFFNTNNKDVGQWTTEPILDDQVNLLNILEDFSLNVKHYNTQDHPALDAVHYLFVDIVEKNAVVIAFMRDIETSSQTYAAVLFLYDSWQGKVERTSRIKNLEKHGFISKTQKKEILARQRKNRLENKFVEKTEIGKSN